VGRRSVVSWGDRVNYRRLFVCVGEVKCLGAPRILLFKKV